MSRDDRDDRRARDRGDDRSRDRGDDRRGSSDRGGDRDRGSDRGRDDRGRDDRGRDDRGGRDRGREDDQGSGSGRGYRYQARTREEVQERGERGANDYDKMLKPGTKMWKVNDGENRIRLLPPTWDGAKHYGFDVKVHYAVGPDRGSYLCPRKHGGGDCPICEERDEVRQENNPDEKYVKDLEAKSRVLVYLVDRDNEKEGVQAWFMPWSVDKDITKVSVDKDTGEVLAIDHPEEGFDVMFDKSGTKDRTKYEGISVARRPSPLGKSAWLDHAMDHPLSDQLQVFPHEHIAKAFGGKGRQRDSRDDRNDDRRGNDRDDRRDDNGRDERDGRGRDDRDDRSVRERDDRGSRDRDDGRRGSRDDRRDDEPTWESVHAMSRTELEDLIELKDLPIKPRQAKDDEDLADWVCDEMKLKKGATKEPADDSRGRRRVDDEPPKEDRMSELRRRRAD